MKKIQLLSHHLPVSKSNLKMMKKRRRKMGKKMEKKMEKKAMKKRKRKRRKKKMMREAMILHCGMGNIFLDQDPHLM